MKGTQILGLGLLGIGAYAYWFWTQNLRWPWEPAPPVARRLVPRRTVTPGMLRKTTPDDYALKYKIPRATDVNLGSYRITATNPRLNKY